MVAKVAKSHPSQTISAFDAKNGLGRLLDRVEAGEELIITRHGEPVARLVPMQPEAASGDALDRIRAVREKLRTTGVKISRSEIRTWINEGRR